MKRRGAIESHAGGQAAAARRGCRLFEEVVEKELAGDEGAKEETAGADAVEEQPGVLPHRRRERLKRWLARRALGLRE